MTETKSYDIVVIGGGPGGYVAAIIAAQSGQKIALIEKNLLGGTCLNIGCIPTKALIAHAQNLKKIQQAHLFGIKTGPVSFDFAQMKKTKDSVVLNLRTSLESLIKANKIDVYKGTGTLLSANEIKVKGDESFILKGKTIILATGSEPTSLKSIPVDNDLVLDSTSMLELTKLPKTLAVIGGGYIGCEFASLYARLGVKVTIIEALPSLLQSQEKKIRDLLTDIFKKDQIEVFTNSRVEKIEKEKNLCRLFLQDGKVLEVEKVLISIGRKVYTENLGLEKAGILTDKSGYVLVNHRMETNVPGIYAVGDMTGILMLEHVAYHQGIIAALNATGKKGEMDYKAIPSVIFTDPEIASAGLTLEQAEEKGYVTNSASYPFKALGKAQASLETEGFVQIISDKKTNAIIGAHMIGPEASVMIAEMALAIQNELTLESIIDTVHAHPTFPEAWLEAALVAYETPIHFAPKRKK